MPRARDGAKRKNRRKKILGEARGYWGRRSKTHRSAKEAVRKAGQYAYRDRKARKRDFRRLWISRISAAARQEGMSYSRFINGLDKSGVRLDRKTLSNLAIEDPGAFKTLTETAKKSLAG